MEVDPLLKFWFLKGTAKGRLLVYLYQCWSCVDINKAATNNLVEVPSSVGEWILIFDGLAAVSGAVTESEVNLFVARVQYHPTVVTPKAKDS